MFYFVGADRSDPGGRALLQRVVDAACFILLALTGLILVAEPYYNEAGYEKQRGSQQGAENSRLYNEMVRHNGR